MDKWMHKARTVVNHKADKIWHRWEGFLQYSLVAYFFFNAGFGVHLAIKLSVFAYFFAQTLGDIYWNWQHRKQLKKTYGHWILYPGNGRGTPMESFVTWVHGGDTTYTQRYLFTIFVKVVGMVLGVVWWLAWDDLWFTIRYLF